MNPLAVLTIAAAFMASSASLLLAQTIDTLTLTGDVALTIVRDTDGTTQTLMAGGEPLISAQTITRTLEILDPAGEPAAAVFLLEDEGEDCAPTPLVVSSRDGRAFNSGRLGTPCLAYAISSGDGQAVFLNAPDFHRLGEVFSFQLGRGIQTIGPIGYAPQPDWTWDLLRRNAEAPGQDLFAYAPVHARLVELWQNDLFVYAQHLGARGLPASSGTFFYQPGCILAQCTFAIGLLAVDPTNEQVFSAYLNEGAPDVRPPLEEWSEPALVLYESWRSGDLR
ncbi:MAG: hypothetical protein Rhims3KO_15650 [Hyphomicrobiales bacterium]